MGHINEVGTLIVHLCALVACFYLWRKAPDAVQLGILGLIAASMAIYTFCDLLILLGVGRNGIEFMGIDRVWPIRAIAAGVAHWAMLTYLLRQVWLTTGFCAVLKPRREHAD